MKIKSISVVIFYLSLVLCCFAKVQLPSIFNNGMVLQRDCSVKVWGYATPDSTVTVSGSCMLKDVNCVSNSSGQWQTSFQTKSAPGPYTLVIKDTSDNSTIRFDEVLCGEVWLCSGQSNMAFYLNKSHNATEAISQADKYSNIRLFKVPMVSSLNEEFDVDTKWQPCFSKTVPEFSAIGYFFSRYIYDELKVPVGVIQAAWGGSKIEAWTPLQGYEGIERLDSQRHWICERSPGTNEYKQRVAQLIDQTEQWQQQASQAIATGQSVSDLPAMDINLPQDRKGFAGLYNAMICPVQPYTIKGVLWYQGEANYPDGMIYYERTKALVDGWRKAWGQGDFPFYYVQLAPYKYGREGALPLFWEAQTQCLNLKNTGMAVTIDIGNYEDIHPANKQEVARRLSLWALAKDYGKTDVVFSGPIFNSAKFENSKAIVKFDYVGQGLSTGDGKAPSWFEIAGDDGKFYPAEAKILSSDEIVASSLYVSDPKVVRFAWSKKATPNLINKSGLPAPAFSSDADLRLLPSGQNLALGKTYMCTDDNTHTPKWQLGLTDGSWEANGVNCFATNRTEKFPKYVTVDLDRVYTISKVHIGTPDFGSTKTIEIRISDNGKKFKTVGDYTFKQNKTDRAIISFPPHSARYVRVAYLDTYPEDNKYNHNYVFTTELEVYE